MRAEVGARTDQLERTGGTSSQFAPPSWIDRAVSWATTRRVPWWVVLLGVLVVQLLLVNLGMALAKATRADHVFMSLQSVYGVYGLAAYGYLNARAGWAFDRFRPALAVPDAEAAAARHRLTTMPRRVAVVAALSAVPLGVSATLFDPLALRLLDRSLVGALIALVPAVYFSGACVVVLFVQIARML